MTCLACGVPVRADQDEACDGCLPMMEEDARQADHEMRLAGAAALGRCNYSGLRVSSCEASICDCHGEVRALIEDSA